MYFGIYKSSTEGQTGCVQEFVTTASSKIAFPAQVMYFCKLCNASHGFRYMRCVTVNTPSMQRQFDEACASLGRERDVQVEPLGR